MYEHVWTQQIIKLYQSCVARHSIENGILIFQKFIGWRKLPYFPFVQNHYPKDTPLENFTSLKQLWKLPVTVQNGIQSVGDGNHCALFEFFPNRSLSLDNSKVREPTIDKYNYNLLEWDRLSLSQPLLSLHPGSTLSFFSAARELDIWADADQHSSFRHLLKLRVASL